MKQSNFKPALFFSTFTMSLLMMTALNSFAGGLAHGGNGASGDLVRIALKSYEYLKAAPLEELQALYETQKKTGLQCLNDNPETFPDIFWQGFNSIKEVVEIPNLKIRELEESTLEAWGYNLTQDSRQSIIEELGAEEPTLVAVPEKKIIYASLEKFNNEKIDRLYQVTIHDILRIALGWECDNNDILSSQIVNNMQASGFFSSLDKESEDGDSLTPAFIASFPQKYIRSKNETSNSSDFLLDNILAAGQEAKLQRGTARGSELAKAVLDMSPFVNYDGAGLNYDSALRLCSGLSVLLRSQYYIVLCQVIETETTTHSLQNSFYFVPTYMGQETHSSSSKSSYSGEQTIYSYNYNSYSNSASNTHLRYGKRSLLGALIGARKNTYTTQDSSNNYSNESRSSATNSFSGASSRSTYDSRPVIELVPHPYKEFATSRNSVYGIKIFGVGLLSKLKEKEFLTSKSTQLSLLKDIEADIEAAHNAKNTAQETYLLKVKQKIQEDKKAGSDIGYYATLSAALESCRYNAISNVFLIQSRFLINDGKCKAKYDSNPPNPELPFYWSYVTKSPLVPIAKEDGILK